MTGLAFKRRLSPIVLDIPAPKNRNHTHLVPEFCPEVPVAYAERLAELHGTRTQVSEVMLDAAAFPSERDSNEIRHMMRTTKQADNPYPLRSPYQNEVKQVHGLESPHLYCYLEAMGVTFGGIPFIPTNLRCHGVRRSRVTT